MSFKAERVSLRIKKTDGLEAIRTPDLRRVNTGGLALEGAFSCLSGLPSAVGQTTTRNASAPS